MVTAPGPWLTRVLPFQMSCQDSSAGAETCHSETRAQCHRSSEPCHLTLGVPSARLRSCTMSQTEQWPLTLWSRFRGGQLGGEGPTAPGSPNMHGQEHSLCDGTGQLTCVAFAQPSEAEGAPRHLADGETKAQRGSGTCLAHTAERGAGRGPGVSPTCPQCPLLKVPFICSSSNCLSRTPTVAFIVVSVPMDPQGTGPAGR